MAAPQVTNIVAQQRADGSGLVDVYYTLSGGEGPMTITMVVSSDKGQTWGVTPSPGLLSGHIGPGVTNGTNRHIVWNAGADKLAIYWPQCKVRIFATDGSGGPEEITILLPGGVPLVMVRIPAGSFQMGSPDTERGHASYEGPVHVVNIGYDFYMGKYEVTQAQWLAVMGSWPDIAPATWYGLGDNYPAYRIQWYWAQNFCAALNTHITATGQGPATMRLPSSAEWEYACRAGTQTRFYFGDSLDVDDYYDEDDGIRSQYMWYGKISGGGNGYFGSQPVGGLLPNAFGLFDMSGNVMEWCEDDWHSSYTGAPTDGSAWVDSPRSRDRVTRGGDWNDNAWYCRSANWGCPQPHYTSDDLGFRLASVR